MTATFVVLANGALADVIARIAGQHAAYDRSHRRVIGKEERDAVVAQLRYWTAGGLPAAVVIDQRNEVCVSLDEWQATTDAWIEDAFLKTQALATREPAE